MNSAIMIVTPLIFVWKVSTDQLYRFLCGRNQVQDIGHGISLSLQVKLFDLINVTCLHQIEHVTII